MKIHRSFKKILPLLLIIFGACASSESPLIPSISLNTFGGFKYGDAREFVYTSNTILSELEWPMYPMITLGAGLDLSWKQGLEIKADITAGLPGNTGIFKDSDFMNQPASSVKTHYSQHEGILQHAIDVRSDVLWNFKTPLTGPGSTQKIEIAPSLGFRYLLYKWAGVNGYLQHAPETAYPYSAWTEATVKSPCSGTVIDYQQEYWMPTAGVTITFPIKENFLFGFGANLSPFVYCYGIDNHYANISASGDPVNTYSTTSSTKYFDIMTGGLLIEPSIKFEWLATNRITFFFDGYWTFISGLRGDTYKQATGSTTYTKTYLSNGAGGGASFSALDLKLGIKLKVFNSSANQAVSSIEIPKGYSKLNATDIVSTEKIEGQVAQIIAPFNKSMSPLPFTILAEIDSDPSFCVYYLNTKKFPKYTDFFRNSAILHGKIEVCRYSINKAIRSILSEAGEISPDPNKTTWSLAEIQEITISSKSLKGNLSEESKNEFLKNALYLTYSSIGLSDFPEKSETVITTSQVLLHTIKNDFTGINALEAPKITSGVQKSTLSLTEDIKELPELAQGTTELLAALSYILSE